MSGAAGTRLRRLVACAAAALGVSVTVAQSDGDAPVEGSTSAVREALHSGDRAALSDTIGRYIRRDPGAARGDLRAGLSAEIADAGFPGVAAWACVRAAAAQPQFPQSSSQLLRRASKHFRRAGDWPDSAWAAASALYVAPPDELAHCVSLLSETLAQMPGGGDGVARRFRLRMARALGDAPPESLGIDALTRIPSGLVSEELAMRDGDWYGAHLGGAHLLLMSGEVEGGRDALERALDKAPESRESFTRRILKKAVMLSRVVRP